MHLWIKEIVSKYNRRKIEILFGDHSLKDKNLTVEDLDYAETTVRIGKIDQEKSTKEKERICYKNYFKNKKKTYFVIVEFYPDLIKIITVNKKKGKY